MNATGQDHYPREYIRRAVDSGRLSHAYLLLGADAAEIRDFALEMSKLIFCSADTANDSRPCGQCASCRSVDHGNHPGVTVYGPRTGKSVVDIDTVRSLCERSHYSRDHVFVAILEHADTMNAPAANALLKTLEEPTGHFIIVLLAASTGVLLPTIVSRCHRLYFPRRHAGQASDVDPEVLDQAWHSEFFADHEIREWLSQAVPEAKTQRDRVRALLSELVERYRQQLIDARDGDLDRGLDHLDLLLDLSGSLDGQVSPELVLERALDHLRRS